MISRRQLGLIALTLALVHALASSMMLSPTYYSSWFQKPSVVLPANVTEQVRLDIQVEQVECVTTYQVNLVLQVLQIFWDARYKQM